MVLDTAQETRSNAWLIESQSPQASTGTTGFEVDTVVRPCHSLLISVCEASSRASSAHSATKLLESGPLWEDIVSCWNVSMSWGTFWKEKKWLRLGPDEIVRHHAGL